MGHSLPEAVYLEQAELLFNGRLAPSDLPQLTAHLPPLNQTLLDDLADHASQLALTQPKHGWAVTAVAEAAAAHISDFFLQALAAWYAARAANAWYRPDLVEPAVARARTGFTQSGEPDWLAACDWQLHAEPWTRNSFQTTASILKKALLRLENSDLASFVPFCRLSLAYSYILTAQFEAAEDHIAQSEAVFQQQNDHLHQARCWLHYASALRRQLHYPEALNYLENALQIFIQFEAPLDQAKTCYQLGYYELNQGGDYQRAEQLFASAATLFEEREVALWQALCLNGLVQLYNNQGRLAETHHLLAQIREIYDRFPIVGLQADTAVESGAQSLFRGDWPAAIHFFQQAESKYNQLNLTYMAAMAAVYQGDAYTEAAHYPRALHCLEKALRAFEQLADDGRQARCKLRLARVWLALTHDEIAQPYLQAAADYYKQAQEPAYFKAILNYQAEILFRQQKQQEAIDILRHALKDAQKQGRQLYNALSQRTLGEALCRSGQLEEGGTYLKAAARNFQEMGTILELATCQLLLGNYYQQIDDTTAAEAAWQEALRLNQTAVPAISWQAHANLAALAVLKNDLTSALEQYRQAVSALVRLRQNLWQPALAGSFLNRPAMMLDKAVTLAGQNGSEHDTLQFIEESKAQIVNQQLAAATTIKPQSEEMEEELVELAAEIRWLQQKILANEPGQFLTAAQTRKWHNQLIQKAREYDLKVAQVERQGFAASAGILRAGDFEVEPFRQQAAIALGQNWVALNTYLTDSHLYCVMLTPDQIRSWFVEVTSAVRLALELCTKGGNGRDWTIRHLAALGNWLLPEFVQELLAPTTTLLISPHRLLHRLPWPALHFGQATQPLVTACIPVIIPSWRTLLHLWQRTESDYTSIGKGIVLAVSEFKERYQPLPQTEKEAAYLSQLFADDLHLMQNEMATFSQLQRLAREDGLANYDFLHIASHASADQLTGRLSSLALYDRDLWLDEIYQLAPLPRLVTLSACSGLLSRLFTGDEQISLALTCLAAGTRHVVGSLWPLIDAGLAELMVRFYSHLKMEPAVARALAETQRECYRTGMPMIQWGSLLCIGQP